MERKKTSVASKEKPNTAPRRNGTKQTGSSVPMRAAILLLILSLALFVFLWNYWIKDIFAPAERIELPDFVGNNYDSMERDPDIIKLYN